MSDDQRNFGSGLQDEIKQVKPFPTLREEAFLNLLRTAARLGHDQEQAFRSRGVSPTQYNVLRILRGAGAPGLGQFEIGERLVAQVPDVPRILERMERSGWVVRERGTSDRRMMIAKLTAEGLNLVDSMDGMVCKRMEALFPALGDEAVGQMNQLLVAARRN